MATQDPDAFAISPAHLALLTRWANADPIRKAVNLILLRTVEEKSRRAVISRAEHGSRILAERHGSPAEPEEWAYVPFDFDRIHRRLTLMSNPPAPWWHQLPFWYWLSFHITERIDHWLWHPLQNEGKIELNVNDATYWVIFRCIDEEKIELSYSTSEVRDSGWLDPHPSPLSKSEWEKMLATLSPARPKSNPPIAK